MDLLVPMELKVSMILPTSLALGTLLILVTSYIRYFSFRVKLKLQNISKHHITKSQKFHHQKSKFLKFYNTDNLVYIYRRT